MAYIEFQNIDLTFRTQTQRIPIFENMALTLDKGSYTVIYGASGKGKSTILNLISGFVVPNKGSVMIDGRDVSHMSDKDKCKYRNNKIGYMFQNFNLIQQMNVIDNVAVPLWIGGVSKKKAYEAAAELIKSVNLETRMKEYPNTLSGGEQQRVAFARAIINKPEILLADEPIANLDRKNGDVLLEYFDNLSEQGVTIVCVSHDERMRKDKYNTINIEDLSLAQ